MPALFCAAVLAVLHGAVSAQNEYPQGQTIRLIVPYAPGGGTDTIARTLAERVGKARGWTIVVENKPGVAGSIGIDYVAKSKPDGLTLGLGQTSNLAINPTLMPKPPFNVFKDIAPVVLVAAQPTVMVARSDLPYKTLKEFLAATTSKPDSVAMASTGTGSLGHLAGAALGQRVGTSFRHIPYKGAPMALNDIVSGHVEFMFNTPMAVLPFVRDGKLRALAVSSSHRSPVLPDAPTFEEIGIKNFNFDDWKALVMPAGTSPTIVAQWNSAVNEALKEAEMTDRLRQDGSVALGGSAQHAQDFIKQENDRWGALVKETKASME